MRQFGAEVTANYRQEKLSNICHLKNCSRACYFRRQDKKKKTQKVRRARPEYMCEQETV